MARATNCSKKIVDFVYEHVSFIAPLFVTYVFGFIYVMISVSSEGIDLKNTPLSAFLKIGIDGLVPTTATYLLCESIDYIIASFQTKSKMIICFIFLFIFVVLYDLIYALFLLSGSIYYVITVILFTIVLLVMNCWCYKGLYLESHNENNLV